MDENFAIQLFEGKRVRIVWDEEQEKYYFSVVDIVQVLTDSENPTDYLKKIRKRDPELGLFIGTNCPQVMMMTHTGKNRITLAADLQGIFRLIQSIPSKKAEPVKQWLAQLGEQRIDQMIDPELTFQMAVEDYRRQGYSDKWINERMRSIEMRKELTDEWQRNGINGTIILPDNWILPAGASFTASTSQGLEDKGGHYYNSNKDNYSHNTYSISQWEIMEAAGAVFLPAAGKRSSREVKWTSYGFYWSATVRSEKSGYCFYFGSDDFYSKYSEVRYTGESVRLVR